MAAGKKILAVKWRRLGDTILWTSALEALRSWQSDAEIDIACPQEYINLFEQDTRFSKRYALSGNTYRNRELARQAQSVNYDWVLNFHASQRSRRFCRQAKGKKQLFHHHSRSGVPFGSDLRIVNLGQPMSAQERDLNVLRTLGWAGQSPPSKVHVPQPNQQWAAQSLSEASPIPGLPWILFGVRASRPAKQWPSEHYLKLFQLLKNRANLAVVDPSPGTLPKDFLRILKQVAVCFHTEHLWQLAAYLSHATLYVGGDSGVKHLACALGVPTVTLFGPESVGEWHGYDPVKHKVLVREVACRKENPHPPAYAWCGEWICPLGSHACLNLISPEEVFQQVQVSLPSPS